MPDQVTCNICGSSTYKVIYAANEAQIHQIVKCTDCGLMYAAPLQVRNYDLYNSKKTNMIPLEIGDPTILHSFDKLPDYKIISTDIQKYVRKGLILDVGCYTGTFLNYLQEQGWEVMGVELDARAVVFAQKQFGLKIVNDALESLDTNQYHNKFEAITMLHLIEHLDDPAAILTIARRLLKPKGVLVIETPTFDSLIYKIMGRRERSLSCDGHIFFYTVGTLSILMKKVGFEVVKVKKVGRTISLGRLLWNIGVMSKNKNIQRNLQLFIDKFNLLNSGPRIYINMHDMVRMYCRPE